MGTHSFIRYIVTVTVTILVTTDTNEHLQQFACNEETEIIQLFKHEERCNRYNFRRAQETRTM
jgi:hypothetical protein